MCGRNLKVVTLSNTLRFDGKGILAWVEGCELLSTSLSGNRFRLHAMEAGSKDAGRTTRRRVSTA